jgi:hypothetical protein
LFVDVKDELFLLLLVKIKIGEKTINNSIKGRISLQRAPRRNFYAALRTFFLAETQVFFNASLTKSVKTLLKGMAVSHNGQADWTRKLLI